ncbi:(2Fe-2S) ferredoxin domain-containing protein [Thermaerobacillus caldiproteolyticus]|uniref:(2Fe-2S) ferredoxin n=1 Tax=Thermaerobacillus caldiproteolyticus TaxID=247480 RepID=A0A7W0BZA2_9BACL|nr:(2Fe-2S) ferredoxin domain-containing protein [Anoxybacillus caldiproteolyticus]MBA2873909.1 (2Fe-2S) ferredoxin [Anoxybacillus caldiproteolyticus]
MATWDFSKMKHHIFICNGSSCMRSGEEEVTQAIRNEISVQGADDLIHTTRTGCNGRCQDACVVIVYPDGTWYKNMDEQTAKELVRGLADGRVYNKHVSHYYKNGVFQRTEGTVSGKRKHVQ